MASIRRLSSRANSSGHSYHQATFKPAPLCCLPLNQHPATVCPFRSETHFQVTLLLTENEGSVWLSQGRVAPSVDCCAAEMPIYYGHAQVDPSHAVVHWRYSSLDPCARRRRLGRVLLGFTLVKLAPLTLRSPSILRWVAQHIGQIERACTFGPHTFSDGETVRRWTLMRNFPFVLMSLL